LERQGTMIENTVTIRGIAPLLMHNGALAIPTNPIVRQMKEITSSRKKTDEQFAELARLEFLGGLYLDKSQNVILPSTVLEASVRDGAKKSKLGKAFASAVMINDDALLEYGDKLTPDELWEAGYYNQMTVVVQKNRVYRTRPMFADWSATFQVSYNPDQINEADLKKAITDAGWMVGLCDFRPRYGQFEMESFE
jgi:hypothetical protein